MRGEAGLQLARAGVLGVRAWCLWCSVLGPAAALLHLLRALTTARPRRLQRLPNNLRGVFSLRRRSALGALYLLITLAFPLTGLAYFLAPHYTLYHTLGYVFGKSTLLLWKLLGGGLMTLLPAITYTLKASGLPTAAAAIFRE